MATCDAAWFEDLYRTHHPAVLRYAVRRVGPDDADDVVSEVFATAWRRRTAVGEPPLPWLYRAAHHHLLHAQRGRARGAEAVRRLAAEPPRHIGGPEPRDPMLDLLDQLPDADAELLRLVAWEGLGPAPALRVVSDVSILDVCWSTRRAARCSVSAWCRPRAQRCTTRAMWSARASSPASWWTPFRPT